MRSQRVDQRAVILARACNQRAELVVAPEGAMARVGLDYARNERIEDPREVRGVDRRLVALSAAYEGFRTSMNGV